VNVGTVAAGIRSAATPASNHLDDDKPIIPTNHSPTFPQAAMKTPRRACTHHRHHFALGAATLFWTLQVAAQPPVDATRQSTPIPMDQIGAVAGKSYQGDGLAITATANGARLHCDFQQLEGQATSEGLWLNSTTAAANGEHFRLVATAVSRQTGQPTSAIQLPGTGSVCVAGSMVRFDRAGLTEEYSVSMDGVRQDFVLETRPDGEGDLSLELGLTGATAKASAKGARLVLDGSGRALAYGRLHVVDARGHNLPAQMRVISESLIRVIVADAAAVYPVRIDPTFSDEDWGSMGGLLGADEFVSAAVADAVGNLYIGGYFSVVGDVRANYIAKWDGSEWSDLAGGVDYSVWSLAVSGPDLYVGGDFSWAGETETEDGIPANRIAKWDGTNWSALGSGIGGEPGFDVWDYVAALAVVGSEVYAGGIFETAGGVPVANIAKWNGSEWSSPGAGMDSDVMALAVIGTDLYAGGGFTSAGGNEVNYIARWNGSSWSALGSGVDNWIHALAVIGTDLYAGGEFSTAGGLDAYYIARWNGSTWSPVGSGVDDRVNALAVSGTDLYAGGWFSTAGETHGAYYVAKWNGSTWSALGEGADDYVTSLAVVGNTLFVGGDFELVGGHVEIVEGFPELVGQKEAYYIAQWDGTDWSALGSGLSGFVYSLAVSGTSLYAGGDFTTADVNPANNIARWDGSRWLALGTGMDWPVKALAQYGPDLIAGGEFTTAGGTAANHIARWNGSAWSSLGSGMDDFADVSALVVSGNDLYAGGDFFMAGGVEASYVAKWNGNAWSPVGSGLYTSVNTLAVLGTELYAGGYLFVSKWDGSTWSDLGSGLGGEVFALAVVGSDLFVGGSFTTAGETAANGIARWDGTSWSALGSGVDDGFVSTLAVSGTDLYVGGYFTTAGGNPANSIAKWDGGAWSALGSGTGAGVYSLAVFGTDLYVGGDFISIGNRVSAYAARAKIGVNSVAGGRIGNLTYAPATGLSFTFLGAATGQPYRIQRSSSLAPNSWTDVASFIYSGPTVIADPIAVGPLPRFYRAVTP